MAANTYECMFLLDTTKVAGDVPAAAKQLEGLLSKNQAEILASRQWDERRLAYPIKGHKKGLYYLAYFRSEGKNLANIERECALNEMILRQLFIRVHPKLADTMLTLARDEHALALQAVPEGVEAGEIPIPDKTDESRPRRGRRHGEAAGRE
jgi:small subunit ribosomal protein S6